MERNTNKVNQTETILFNKSNRNYFIQHFIFVDLTGGRALWGDDQQHWRGVVLSYSSTYSSSFPQLCALKIWKSELFWVEKMSLHPVSGHEVVDQRQQGENTRTNQGQKKRIFKKEKKPELVRSLLTRRLNHVCASRRLHSALSTWRLLNMSRCKHSAQKKYKIWRIQSQLVVSFESQSWVKVKVVKWCQKSEMSIIWCISITNNVKWNKKFNETAQMANFTYFQLIPKLCKRKRIFLGLENY